MASRAARFKRAVRASVTEAGADEWGELRGEACMGGGAEGGVIDSGESSTGADFSAIEGRRVRGGIYARNRG